MVVGRSNSWRIICLVIMVYFIPMVSLSYQSDTILPGQSIHSKQTITSQRGIFVLGFFSSGYYRNVYVGIWYKSIPLTIVWTANRDTPIPFSDRDYANLILTTEGDLQLQVHGRKIWNTNTISTDLHTTKAVLLYSGNLVVGSDSSPHMWESFNYPTDTWLPGAKIGLDATTGKTNPTILTTGVTFDDLYAYSFGIDPSRSGGFLIWQRKRDAILKIGALDFLKMNLKPKLDITFNVSGVNYATFHTLNDFTPIRMQLNVAGELSLCIWDEKSAQWTIVWPWPDLCNGGATCGRNGICSASQSPVCSCPKGFQPNYTSISASYDYFAGCARRHGSQCLKDKDEFMALRNIRWPLGDGFVPIGSADCQSACANDCKCSAYSNASGCHLWYGDLLGMEQQYNSTDGKTIYLRTSPKKGAKMQLWIPLALSTTLLILILGCLSYYVYGKKLIKAEAKDIGQDLLSFDLEMTNKRHISQVPSNNDLHSGNRDLALPIFSLSSVFAATETFSSSNKLGEGGFGPVYKGKLRNGQEVAVKRLSKLSDQGLDELINEAKLIAKLQHTNLVRLFGCCIQKDEKILIYEYMPNKSLDFFIFDQIKKKMLDWSRRMHIIEGIAQGLLYLHHYSRLRIVHRDLKASNILLDANMEPKISDFGMARIFGGNRLQENTKHVVGTFGYMPPEYALEGIFSVKTDVFSFGVLLLEILSGERITSFCHENCLNLLAYAWNLWTNDAPLELIDPILKTSCDLSLALRYVHVGLLCVQEHPDDRPSVSDIVAMIGNEMKVIEVQPKQPAYLARRIALEVNSKRISLNDLTYSTIEPR